MLEVEVECFLLKLCLKENWNIVIVYMFTYKCKLLLWERYFELTDREQLITLSTFNNNSSSYHGSMEVSGICAYRNVTFAFAIIKVDGLPSKQKCENLACWPLLEFFLFSTYAHYYTVQFALG